MNEPHFRFTSLFVVKGERFYDYFFLNIFLGKNSNFYCSPLSHAPLPSLGIPFSEINSF